MKAQHTPGGWFRLDRPENAMDEARILTHISNGAHIICTLGTTCTDGSPAHSANARLISAAPDLLEALTTIMANLQAMECSVANESMAFRAIAKAKGGEQ